MDALQEAGESDGVIGRVAGANLQRFPSSIYWNGLAEWGIRHILGQGYYAFLDVGPWLDRAGMEDSGALGSVLAESFGLAVVPGVYFSRFGTRWIRFSYALQPQTTRAAAERLWLALSSL